MSAVSADVAFALAVLPATIKSLPDDDDDERSLATSTDSGFNVGAITSFAFFADFEGVASFSDFGWAALSTALPLTAVVLTALSDDDDGDDDDAAAFC